MFSRLFKRTSHERTVAGLYGRIVAQARETGFFAVANVPDTVEGRFELVALHAWLVMRRLRDQGPEAAAFNQALFDFMFADMDLNLRELGVSDMKVGEKVKDLASHFYGRINAYEGAMKPDAAPDALAQALDRNLYGSTLPDPADVATMEAYVRAQAAALDSFPPARLLAGEVAFAPAPGPSHT